MHARVVMSMASLSDEALMGRFRAKFDEAAFDALVMRHHQAAFRLAVNLLQDSGAAEDAVQEAFVRIIRHRRKFDPQRAFLPWFRTVLRNVCRDAQRRRQRRQQRLEELAVLTHHAHCPPARDHDCLALLEALDADDRQVLMLRFAEGLSFREIATRLNCSVGAAKKRGQRALARVRRAAAAEADAVEFRRLAVDLRTDGDNPFPATGRRNGVVAAGSETAWAGGTG
jgi:RNA polymerase sigma-70 factor (ECF subfamily)